MQAIVSPPAFLHNFFRTGGFIVLITSLFLLFSACSTAKHTSPAELDNVLTLAGLNRAFGEPFDVKLHDGVVYVSDGQRGTIMRSVPGSTETFANKLNTPSGIAFDKNGDLLVADSGSNTIKKIDTRAKSYETGQMITTFAGIDDQPGFADGDAAHAQFRAPIGIAVAEDGTVYVADTYNDRIRVIRNGTVSTLAGSGRGFADGSGTLAKFDTPCGLALTKDGSLLVADYGNSRIRVVEPNGNVSTLVGTGKGEQKDGLLALADVYSPTAFAIDKQGSIFIADGNHIRVIRSGAFPYMQTLAGNPRGLADGPRTKAQFNRPSGLAVDDNENLFVADSDNRLVRTLSADKNGHVITPDEIAKLRYSAEEFRTLAPPRWPYDPPDAKREIAGTMGEVRGTVARPDGTRPPSSGSSVNSPLTLNPADQPPHFHNGLDIAGSYGEIARFVRDEKVLLPLAASNFGSLREMLRMPTMGYIHVRIGRDKDQKPFNDPRFLFDGIDKPTSVRVPRGSKFQAGEPVGTLNPMNHVHLIAGPGGSEMNALDALILPGITDTVPPVIENVMLFDENWREIETAAAPKRINLAGKIRVIVRAYDRMDGNPDRRRLGVFSVGYAVLKSDGNTLADHHADIVFKRPPSDDLVPLIYGPGSHSDATGETIFNYIATNEVNADEHKEDFLDLSGLEPGTYILRVFASDYFGNTATKDINFVV